VPVEVHAAWVKEFLPMDHKPKLRQQGAGTGSTVTAVISRVRLGRGARLQYAPTPLSPRGHLTARDWRLSLVPLNFRHLVFGERCATHRCIPMPPEQLTGRWRCTGSDDDRNGEMDKH
jgi:hypothetical protein